MRIEGPHAIQTRKMTGYYSSHAAPESFKKRGGSGGQPQRTQKLKNSTTFTSILYTPTSFKHKTRENLHEWSRRPAAALINAVVCASES